MAEDVDCWLCSRPLRLDDQTTRLPGFGISVHSSCYRADLGVEEDRGEDTFTGSA